MTVPPRRTGHRRLRVAELKAERIARGVVTGTIPGDIAREERERIDREPGDARRTLGSPKTRRLASQEHNEPRP